MSLHQRLARLQRLSTASLARTLARRAVRPGRALLERALYSPQGPRRPKRIREIAPIALFHSSVNKPSFSGAFLDQYPAEAEALIATAHGILEGSFPLFGQPMDLRAHFVDGQMPWHTDVRTGHRWKQNEWFSHVRSGKGADIRCVWELSRCAHFVTLGQAYVLTRDERLSEIFSNQLEDWIERNPPKYGPNWVSPMEVALRAANWLAAWDLFQRSPSISGSLRQSLGASLWEHGRHILSHLEWGGELSTNHYLANLLGLWYIGRAINEPEWASFAGGELAAALLDQTLADGMDYEASTAYHRLVTEIGFYFALLEPTVNRDASPAGRRAALVTAFGSVFVERLTSMMALPGDIAAPNGRVPLIGDNDSARVHWLMRREDADMAYLGDFAALLLGETGLRDAGRPAASECAWIFGMEAATSLTGTGRVGTAVSGRAPGPAGLAVLRGENDAAYLLMSPNGTRGVGNHTHNDKLSVLLSVGKDDFLVDPGISVYTADPERRDAFRSTAAHSTVMIDGLEQNRFTPDNLFEIIDDAKIVPGAYAENRHVSASHTGYRRLSPPVIHERKLERVADPLGWVIEDNLTGAGQHRADWTFLCGAGITARLDGGNKAVLEGAEGFLELVAHSESAHFEISDTVVSPAYGHCAPAFCVKIHWQGKLPFRMVFTLSHRRKR